MSNIRPKCYIGGWRGFFHFSLIPNSLCMHVRVSVCVFTHILSGNSVMLPIPPKMYVFNIKVRNEVTGITKGCWGERQATWSRAKMHWNSVDKCIGTMWTNALKLWGQMHWNFMDKCIETLWTNALRLMGFINKISKVAKCKMSIRDQ